MIESAIAPAATAAKKSKPRITGTPQAGALFRGVRRIKFDAPLNEEAASLLQIASELDIFRRRVAKQLEGAEVFDSIEAESLDKYFCHIINSLWGFANVTLHRLELDEED